MNKTVFAILAIVAATSLVVSMGAPAFAVSQSISQGMAQGGNLQLGLANVGNVGSQLGANVQCVFLTACVNSSNRKHKQKHKQTIIIDTKTTFFIFFYNSSN